MKMVNNKLILSFVALMAIFVFSSCNSGTSSKEESSTEAVVEGSFTITLDQAENGSFTCSPAIPEDGILDAGTVITVTTTPAEGYVFDSGYYAIPGNYGKTAFESMTSVFKVTVDKDMSIGASFIEESALNGFTVTQDVVYAQPGVKKLKYDVFSPNGAENLPCIVIIHGGGWSSNVEDIMRGLARELIKGGQYVVFSIDYRWINTLDGDVEPNKMEDLIGDVFGAIAHIQEHAAEYGGDPTRIAVTGDSAGGHLSASAATMCPFIGDGGFGETEGVYEFMPTYIPEGKTVDQLRDEITSAIQVAAPSYGVFDGELLKNFAAATTDEYLNAIAPLRYVQNVSERAIPHYLIRGTEDPLITDEAVQAYADALDAAGQTVKYVQVEGASHAFFDWKPDVVTKATFAQYGVPYAADMKAFIDAVFYR